MVSIKQQQTRCVVSHSWLFVQKNRSWSFPHPEVFNVGVSDDEAQRMEVKDYYISYQTEITCVWFG